MTDLAHDASTTADAGPAPVAVPGQTSTPHDSTPVAGEEAIRTRVWRNGTLEKENFPFAQVSDYLEQPDTMVWADLVNPGPELLHRLAEELSLDPHAIEDALDEDQRPKATHYRTHGFLTAFVLGLDKNEHKVGLGRVSAFITRQAFVTVRLDETLDVDDLCARWDRNTDILKFGPRALVYNLLDEIVDGFFNVLTALDDATEKIEDDLFDDDATTESHVTKKTFALRRALQTCRRAVVPMREVVTAFAHRPGADTDDAMTALAPYYDDLRDHVVHADEWCDSMRENITSIIDTSTSLSDVQMNSVMKKLTAWAAIIAVPTAVTGYFGQNLPYPGFQQWWGFLLSASIIIGLGIVLYVSFRIRDWL